MESFFTSLKTERTARKNYRSRDEAKADVFDYIEVFYNATRLHSHLGGVSPEAFECAGAVRLGFVHQTGSSSARNSQHGGRQYYFAKRMAIALL